MLFFAVYLVAAFNSLCHWSRTFMIQPLHSTLPPDSIPLVMSLALFKDIDHQALQEIVAELQHVRLKTQEILIRQAQPGDSMYILLHGTLRVVREFADGTEQVLDILGPGVTVGELALLTGQPRGATVSAIEDAELLRLSREAFDRLAERNPGGMMRFAEAMTRRMKRTELVTALQTLFGNLDLAELAELEEYLEWRYLRGSEHLVDQGLLPDGLIIVISGRLRVVSADANASERVVSEIGHGETLGEAALITGDRRPLSVYAVRDTHLVFCPRPMFERVAAKYPHVVVHLARLVVNRFSRTNVPAMPRTKASATFAVLPAHPDAPIKQFAARLSEALARFGAVLHLSSERIDHMLNRQGLAQIAQGHPANLALEAWLTDQETKHSLSLYEADASWTEWTARCTRQADRIMIVGLGRSQAQPGALEEELARLGVLGRQELVLIYPDDGSRPSGTQDWLSRRQLSAHYHVRLESGADIMRLARQLTGQAVGLVLSGGGARGWAHIGVIRALEEAGIPIDLIGATSQGALIGGCYALGMTPAEIMEAAHRFSSPRQLRDYTLPLVSLFASRKVTKVMLALFGTARIEDLWRPFFCVSSNLTRAEPMLHRSGPLWKYVRASTALPGIFSPVLDKGEILVDGVSMDNLPIEAMLELTEGGPVVAVDVVPQRDLHDQYIFGPSVSGWQVLWSKLNPFAHPVSAPSIVTTLARAREVNDVYHRQFKQQLARIYLAPALDHFPLLDFSRWEEIVEAGYEAARQALDGQPEHVRAIRSP